MSVKQNFDRIGKIILALSIVGGDFIQSKNKLISGEPICA
jgi:hypothetical protein